MNTISSDWQPSGDFNKLRQRAQLLQTIRNFFYARDVLEVETPLLSQATVTDVHLHSMEVTLANKTHYLQTSPEFAMKRLLAAGSGAIFQICKACEQVIIILTAWIICQKALKIWRFKIVI